MERPGLLEIAVYAVVLIGAASWIYGLPPFTHEFTHEAGDRVQVAVQPVSGLGNTRGEEPGAETTSVSRAIGGPALDNAEAAESNIGADPGVDRKPNLLVVTARSLNMRAEPDAGSALVGNYPRGALVEQVDKNGNWILVRAEDETTGWMYAGYLGAPDN